MSKILDKILHRKVEDMPLTVAPQYRKALETYPAYAHLSDEDVIGLAKQITGMKRKGHFIFKIEDRAFAISLLLGAKEVCIQPERKVTNVYYGVQVPTIPVKVAEVKPEEIDLTDELLIGTGQYQPA